MCGAVPTNTRGPYRSTMSETVNQLQLTKLHLVVAGHAASCGRLLARLSARARTSEDAIGFATASYSITVADHADRAGFDARLAEGIAGLSAAILAVDSGRGVDRVVRQHAYLLTLAGIRQIVVAVTGLDDTAAAGARYAEVERAAVDWLAAVGDASTRVVAVGGDDEHAPAWSEGPRLIEALEHLQPMAPPVDMPLRMPITEAVGEAGSRRYSGRILTGLLDMGDTLMFSSSNVTARVLTLKSEDGGEQLNSAEAGQTVRLTLDTDAAIAPGELASHVETPPLETDVFRVRLAWIGDAPIEERDGYHLRRFGQVIPVTVQSIESVSANGESGEMIEATMRTPTLIALDPFASCGPTGSVALYDGDGFLGAGQINMRDYADQRDLITVRSTNLVRVEHTVTDEHRIRRNGHRGAVLWLTGLSGAGKSTIAIEVEKRLFEAGYQVYVLDGDNIRHGLNANLGFSPEDRAENIRRVGEVSALFASAGFITITAFISPYRSDRDRARVALPDGFHEVYIKADLAVCESRDPKGLYKKARAGEILEFTGISAPYEAPLAPELTVDTSTAAVDECVGVVVEHVKRHFALDAA